MKILTNEDRADAAGEALRAYATAIEGRTYDSAEIILTDLLGDLMHYAHRERVDFKACTARAATSFEQELAEQINAKLPKP